MTRSVTIVGAGPGGLASAMLLARAGLRVRVLERLDTPGGRTSSLESGTGFRFDLGPTFFLYPRVLADIFSACGYDLNNEVEMVKLDPQYRLIFGSGGDLWQHQILRGWKMPLPVFHPTIAVHLPGS